MTEVAELDSVLLVHAESRSVIDSSPPPHGRAYSSFLASRPDAAEEEAVALVLDAASDTGARTHIVHVSSARVPPLVAQAKQSGVRVTAETCPHYLACAAEFIADGETQFAACPPIRNAANREALWQALLDGTLDMVVSDHSPCGAEWMGDGDFGRAFGGVSSLQLAPRVVWTQAEKRGFGLTELSVWMSERPAALAGLSDRGRIQAGLRADLCVLDPAAESVVDAGHLRHRHPASPYDGQTIRGAVLQTWVAGLPVLDEVCQPL
jgi:allantoinase